MWADHLSSEEEEMQYLFDHFLNFAPPPLAIFVMFYHNVKETKNFVQTYWPTHAWYFSGSIQIFDVKQIFFKH